MLDREIGARLRYFRLAKGLTQAALGASIGLTHQQVLKYEKGLNRLSASLLIKLGDILDVAPTAFLEGLGIARNEERLGRSLFRADTLKLAAAYEAIPDPSIRQNLLKLTQSMAPRITTTLHSGLG